MKRLFKILFTITLCIILTLINMTGYAQKDILESTQYFYDGIWNNYDLPPTYLAINNKEIKADMPPVVIEDHSLVPARAVFENVGAQVSWDGEKSLVGISLNNIEILLTMNSKTAIVNGKSYELSVPAKNINSRTMIPVRFVAETLDMNVDWDESRRMISIDYPIKNIEKKPIKNDTTATIKKIYYTDEDENLKIIINADKSIGEYSTLKLSNPDRTVIDIKNSIVDIKPVAIEVNKNDILKVRFSQYEINPNVTRIVIDMEKWKQHKIEKSSDGKQLYIYYTILTDESTDIDTDTDEDIDKDTDKTTNEDKDKDIDKDKNTNEDKDETINQDDKRIVVIDPGHGGSDPGACYGTEMIEKDLNLDISLRFYKLLKDAGVNVHMTRYDDTYVGLTERAEIANNLDASLFISVHNNAMTDNPDISGTMTFYYTDKLNQQYGMSGRGLADIVQEELLKYPTTINRNVRQAAFVVLKQTKMPAVLVEVDFITSPVGRENLQNDEFKQNAAQALYLATIRALNEAK